MSNVSHVQDQLQSGHSSESGPGATARHRIPDQQWAHSQAALWDDEALAEIQAMIADLSYRLTRYVHGRHAAGRPVPRADCEALSWMRLTLEDVLATVLGIAHAPRCGPCTPDGSNTHREERPARKTSLGPGLPPNGRQPCTRWS